MRREVRYVLATLGWTGLLTSIVSTGLLNYGVLGGWDWLMIFVASLFAGAIIVEARIVLLASVGAITLTSVLSYVLLTIPLSLGRVGSPVLGSFVGEVALVIVFTAIFPVPIALSVFGGLIGGVVAERFGMF